MRGIPQDMMSQEDLMEVKGIIYMVVHLPSGKFYVRQILRTAHIRFQEHMDKSRKTWAVD
jgi:hypothetical protein